MESERACRLTGGGVSSYEALIKPLTIVDHQVEPVRHYAASSHFCVRSRVRNPPEQLFAIAIQIKFSALLQPLYNDNSSEFIIQQTNQYR